jgi:Tfp pilus assembly protein PilX
MNRNQFLQSLRNENGFVLVIAMVMLVILTLIGIAATNTTIIELNIAGNERQASRQFQAVDSGWKAAGIFLNKKANPPDFINTGDFITVRNYGNGNDGVLNTTFPAATQDGTLANIQYWYQVLYVDDFPALKFGSGYRDFQFDANSNSAGATAIAVTMRKVFKVGY